MSGSSSNTHLVGGPQNNFQDVRETGHAQMESSYDQLIAPVRLQFPATKNVPVQLENIPCAKVVIQNLLGNDPIYVGGLAEQTPYFDLSYPGDFRAASVLYEGMSDVFQVTNANLIQVVGTPLQSFTYKAYPNVKQKVLTNTESPPNPDTTAPMILYSDPSDESTGILITRTSFSITMDEPILASSINTDNVTLTPSGLDYDVFPDPMNTSRIKIQLLEGSSLAYDTTYTITLLTDGIKDLSENALTEDLFVQFDSEPTPPAPPPPDTDPPTVLATNPTDSSTSVPKDKIVTITMSEAMLASSINTSNIQISPSIDHDLFLNPVNTSQIIINHSVAFSYSTQYTITLISSGVKDLAGNGIASPFVFDFTIEAQPSTPDTTPPTVSSIDPVNGATGVVRDKTITITFSEDILESSIDTTNVVLAPLIAVSVFRDPTDATKVIIDPDGDLPGSTQHTVTLPAGGIKDLANNGLASQLQYTFTTEGDPPPPDTTPPTITARSPAISATNVAIDADIVVDFSEALTVPIPSNSFELFAPGPTEVTAVTITYENGNTRLRMNPTSDLNTSTTYTVFVRTTIEDVAGNNLASESSWSFTTAAAPAPPDTTPPTVIAQTPSSGSINATPTTQIIVDFSESMDPATLTTSTIELYRVSDSFKIPCSIALSSISGASNRRATLTPTSSLTYSAQYQAFVRTTVKDVAGNALATQVSWLFTVTAQLSVVSKTPSASATNVSTSTTVVVDFNKALNTGTVTSSTFKLINVSTGIQVSGSIAFANGNTKVTLTPSSSLSTSTQYQVILSASIADTIGITLGSEQNWFFTTTVQFDISNRNPGVSQTNVPISTTIVIDFTKALNTSSVTTTSLKLYDTSTSPFSEKAYSKVFGNGNTRITMTPSSALSYSKQYQIVVKSGSTGVKASDGSTLSSDKSWFFTTENNPVVIEIVYNVSGTSGNWGWEFGNVSSSTDRQGRGLRIKSSTVGIMNALHNVRPTQVVVTVRRIGNFTAPQDDDTMYCRIRNSTGQVKATMTYTGALSISTNSQQITFTDSNQSYKMVNGDYLLIEYDDGDDDEHFELRNVDGGPAAYSVEAYRTSGGTLTETSKDMVATIYGQRM